MLESRALFPAWPELSHEGEITFSTPQARGSVWKPDSGSADCFAHQTQTPLVWIWEVPWVLAVPVFVSTCTKIAKTICRWHQKYTEPLEWPHNKITTRSNASRQKRRTIHQLNFTKFPTPYAEKGNAKFKLLANESTRMARTGGDYAESDPSNRWRISYETQNYCWEKNNSSYWHHRFEGLSGRLFYDEVSSSSCNARGKN